MMFFKTNQNVRTSLEREFPVTEKWYFFQKTWIGRIGNYFFKFRFSLYVRRTYIPGKAFKKLLGIALFHLFVLLEKIKKLMRLHFQFPFGGTSLWYLRLTMDLNRYCVLG